MIKHIQINNNFSNALYQKIYSPEGFYTYIYLALQNTCIEQIKFEHVMFLYSNL